MVPPRAGRCSDAEDQRPEQGQDADYQGPRGVVGGTADEEHEPHDEEDDGVDLHRLPPLAGELDGLDGLVPPAAAHRLGRCGDVTEGIRTSWTGDSPGGDPLPPALGTSDKSHRGTLPPSGCWVK